MSELLKLYRNAQRPYEKFIRYCATAPVGILPFYDGLLDQYSEAEQIFVKRVLELEAKYSALKARIAELEVAQRWIPVSKRLPEDGKPVWVCTIWNEQHSGFLIDGVWGGLFRDFREGEITHWMPLPESPESEE